MGLSAYTVKLIYPHQESNLDYQLRRLVLYPLSYGGLCRTLSAPFII